MSTGTISARDLYESFKSSRADLHSRLLQASPDPTALNELSTETSKLSRLLQDITGEIPSYDQRQCELQLKELEKMLDQLRTKAAPKPKFAFKRRAEAPIKAVQQQPLTSAASSVSTTTVPPGAADPITSPAAPAVSTKNNSTPPVPRSQSTTSGLTSGNTLPNAVTLKDRRDERLLPSSIPPPVPATAAPSGKNNAIPPQTLTLANLEGVILDLRSNGSGDTDDLPYALSALHADGIKRSILFLPRLTGSAMLHNLHNCVVVLGCHQFRMHNSTNTDIYLTTPDAKSPIIEGCTRIRFLRTSDDADKTLVSAAAAPPPLITAQDAPTPIPIDVQDFSHVMRPSPNWTYIPPETRGAAWVGELKAKFDDSAVEEDGMPSVASVLGEFLPRYA